MTALVCQSNMLFALGRTTGVRPGLYSMIRNAGRMGRRAELIEQLRTDPERGWDRFVCEHSGTILKAVDLLINDPDDRMDAYLFVMEKLAEDDARRILAYRAGTHGVRCSFPSWLRLVTRNLVIDWIRSKQGRRTMPRSIASLPPLSRKIFVLVYWERVSHAETVETIRAREGVEISLGDLAGHLEEIEARLTTEYRTNLTHDQLYRRSSPLSFDDKETHDLLEGRIDSGPSPASAERWAELADIRRRYRDALERLTEQERRIAELRFEEEMTAREIAERIGLESYKTVYTQIVRITEKIRKFMKRGD